MRRAFQCTFLCCCLHWAMVHPAAAQTAPHMDVTRTTLKNGLTVLAMEDHTVPTVAVYTLFKAGSRNERPGITGMSHLFEHMMFNGSARFPPKAFDTLVESGGGLASAFTTADTTEYFEEFSSPTLDTVLQLEADRMRALKLDTQNLEQERGIVKEERLLGIDNSVFGDMNELLWNTAYVAHPYRWDISGFMKDLDALQLEDAVAHFRTYYAPNNAVLVVVGDFDTKPLMKWVAKEFERIPRQIPPRPVVNAEPPQRGERRVKLHRPAELPTVMIAYHIGGFESPDTPSLDLLSDILSYGESGRLYRKLVYEDRIASAVFAGTAARADSGLLMVYAQAREGHTTAELEKAVYGILDGIAKDGVTDRELQKARNARCFAHIQQFTTNTGRAGLLAQYEANWGDWRRLYDVLPRYQRVSVDSIRDVARTVFSERNRTVVTLIPENENSHKDAESAQRAPQSETSGEQ